MREREYWRVEAAAYTQTRALGPKPPHLGFVQLGGGRTNIASPCPFAGGGMKK